MVKAHAIRRVAEYTSTGASRSSRVHMELLIRVKSTFFDPATSSLQVSGAIRGGGGDGVSAGQHHTLDLELNRPFTLWKQDGWASVSREMLQNALRGDRAGAVAAVVMDEVSANICLISDYQTVLKQRVGADRAGKFWAKPDADHRRPFFEKTLATLLRSVDFAEASRSLLLASPGFVATEFRKYMVEEGARRGDKLLQRLARDSYVVHSASGHVHSLNEVIKNPAVAALVRDKKYAAETRLMGDIWGRKQKADGRAWYGVLPVEKAVREGAVGPGGGVLLVNNSLFRSQDVATRRRYVALVDKVKADGGDARILSSDHESGQRLDGLGGIAAQLSYPLKAQ